jgi:predicted DNA binding CopG/RHH family protein
VKIGKLEIPSFVSERAETAWWDQNRSEVEAHLRGAIRKRQSAPPLEVMTRGFRKKLKPVAVRLAGVELDAARKIAEDRGIAYDAYIKTLMKA